MLLIMYHLTLYNVSGEYNDINHNLNTCEIEINYLQITSEIYNKLINN